MNLPVRVRAYLILSLAATATALTFALSGGLKLWGLTYIAPGMNIFAIPLGLAGILSFPMWVWYVIALHWLGEWAIIHDAKGRSDQ